MCMLTQPGVEKASAYSSCSSSASPLLVPPPQPPPPPSSCRAGLVRKPPTSAADSQVVLKPLCLSMHPHRKRTTFYSPSRSPAGTHLAKHGDGKAASSLPQGQCCKQLRKPFSRNQTAIAFVPFKSREVAVSSFCRLVHIWCPLCFLPPPEALIAGPGKEDAARKTQPPGAERGVLPRYVQRLSNSSLNTAVIEAAPRPLPSAGAPSRTDLAFRRTQAPPAVHGD